MRRAAGILAALLLLCSTLARVEADPNLSQTWSGVLNFPTRPLLFVISISGSGGKLTASAASPYQGGSAIGVDSISAKGGTLAFAIQRLGVTFQGSIGSSTISGTFTQNSTSVPLVLIPKSAGTTDLSGAWLGTLTTPNGSLLLGLRIASAANGQLSVSIDSPSQGGFGIAASNVTMQNKTLAFDLPSVNASFRGTIGANAIEGTFTQSGATLPLTFERP